MRNEALGVGQVLAPGVENLEGAMAAVATAKIMAANIQQPRPAASYHSYLQH
jgi:hypothetical protein